MVNVYSNALNKRTQAKKGSLISAPIPGREKDMVRSEEGTGAFVFALDKWGRALRFLVLGSESGTYYASAKKFTGQNAHNLISCAKEDGKRLVDLIVDVSDKGRAPKNDPALFALAIVMTHGDKEAQGYAAEAFPKVARIGTHVLHLADYINGMRSWGRAVRRGFSNIYSGWNDFGFALNLVKYANRDGWTHTDVVRLAHVKPNTPTKDALFSRILDKPEQKIITNEKVGAFMEAVAQIKTEKDPKKAAKLISEFQLPREVVPTELWENKVVWEALLPHMGLEALTRNLATMTRVGLLSPMSQGTSLVLDKLADAEEIKKSRLHPIKVLTAYLTYKAGHGQRGSNSWKPNAQIVSALNDTFYAAFGNITPTNKRIMYAMDVSGSMTWVDIMGVIGLTPMLAASALVSFLMRSEKQYMVTAFSSGSWQIGKSYDNVSGISPVQLTKNMSIEEVMKKTMAIGAGATNLSLPMEYARVNNIPVDAFVITTDNELNTSTRHPVQALKAYRDKSGIPARLIVVGMTANGISIADPNDPGMLDVVGFDTAAPDIMNSFIRGEF